MRDIFQLTLVILSFISTIFLLIIVIRAADYGFFCKKTYSIFSDNPMKKLQEELELNRQIQEQIAKEQIAIGKELDSQIQGAKEILILLKIIDAESETNEK